MADNVVERVARAIRDAVTAGVCICTSAEDICNLCWKRARAALEAVGAYIAGLRRVHDAAAEYIRYIDDGGREPFGGALRRDNLRAALRALRPAPDGDARQ